MKHIPLTKGKIALVDDADFETLSQFRWCASQHKKTGQWYAVRRTQTNRKSTVIYMHRYLANAPRGIDVDHADRDGLNNQRGNLRHATRSQNSCNRGRNSNNSSGYKGVSRFRDKWHAQIVQHYKNTHLGYFESKADAAQAYINAAYLMHGEFANA